MSGGLQARALGVTKQRRSILNSLSFHVQPGKLVGLIGPSGSGKTTLMRTIVGLQIPTRGKLEINGRKAGDKSLYGQIGYVTQSPAIYDDLTVEQNLLYFAALVKAPREAITTLLSQVDLKKQQKQLAATLSGGQRARVSLAIALLGSPDIVILDEPTVGLDPVLRQRLWQLFRALADQGKTILISSHVMDEAERCDELLLLRDGGLLYSGAKEQLLKTTASSSVEAAFLALVEGK